MKKIKHNIAAIRGGVIFIIFLITACIVSYSRSQIAYLALFSTIGLVAGFTEFMIAYKPSLAQKIRKGSLFTLSGTLFILALIIGINFQFSQIFIDLYRGIISGALIQFVAARLIIPLFFGNIFCSRACWDGAIFEAVESNLKSSKIKEHRTTRSSSAWIFLLIIIFITSIYSLFHSINEPYTASFKTHNSNHSITNHSQQNHTYSVTQPPPNNNIRWRFLMQNIIIISIGLLAYKFKGSRFFCRKLCPFLTISGAISPYSIFKITPIDSNNCIACGKCTSICPMHIDVMHYVKRDKRVNHPDCIMCEQCVTICPKNCIVMQ